MAIKSQLVYVGPIKSVCRVLRTLHHMSWFFRLISYVEVFSPSLCLSLSLLLFRYDQL